MTNFHQLDRYVKRLDIKIRDLQTEGSMPVDPQMPTLLRDSPGNLVPPASSLNTGANTPLQPLPINTMGGSASMANAAIAQLARAAAVGRTSSPVVAGMQPHPLLNSSHLANAPSIAAMNLNRPGPHRESSAGAINRRRPGHLGTLPAHPSNLGTMRHPSLGPGTPKPLTPGGSRAGSAGPRPRTKNPMTSRRFDPRQQQLQQRRRNGKNGPSKKSRIRGLAGSARASPSTTGEDSGASDDGSEDENGSFQGGGEDMDVDDEGTDDLTKYCYCQKVSYGDMVACDNADCKGQWFHWDCAGLTSEPLGEWLCRDCLRLPRNKIRKG
jgi:inhibitor of growth protein 3